LRFESIDTAKKYLYLVNFNRKETVNIQASRMAMIIEMELESGKVDTDHRDEERGSLSGKLRSVLTKCDAIDQEIKKVSDQALAPSEMEEFSGRVAAVRALAETLMEDGV
jgi:hypothetical protein